MSLTKFSTSSKTTTSSSSPLGARTLATSEALRLASVAFENGRLVARFVNGSSVSVALTRYPRLQKATTAQRNKWRLVGKGFGIHWESLDEDLSVENLLFASAKAAQ